MIPLNYSKKVKNHIIDSNAQEISKGYSNNFFINFFIMLIIISIVRIKKNIVFFLTPSEISNSQLLSNKTIRIGGMVKNNSYRFNENDNNNIFIITDYKKDITINFIGILPDLFREGNGVVVEGIIKKNTLIAEKVFAKHDENYMPENISKKLKENNYWNKKYK